MKASNVKEPRKRTARESVQSGDPVVSEKRPVHSQPVSPGDDVQARIAMRAYEIYLERGSRSSYPLSDWLEAEREILGQECNA